MVGPHPERPELAEQLAIAIPYFEERMRNVKPGITGLAQGNLSYSGKPLLDSVIAKFESDLTNPFKYGRDGGYDRRSHAHQAALRSRLLGRDAGSPFVSRGGDQYPREDAIGHAAGARALKPAP